MQKKLGKINKKDQISAAFFFIFGLVMLVVAIPYGIPVGFVPPGQISPRFLPIVISSAILLVSSLILLTSLFKLIQRRFIFPRTAGVSGDDREESGSSCEDLGKEMSSGPYGNSVVALMMLIILLYFFLLLFAGFIVSSIFAIAATMLVFGDRRWWLICTVSVVIPVLVWVFAVKILHLPVP